MDEGQHYRRLGLFVLVTLALLAGILFVLGGRSLFQPNFTFETYFNESVAGLEIGAPVAFRGVPLGQVTEILTSGSVYEGDVPLVKRKAYIVVRAKISGSSAAQTEQIREEIREYVELGLRAQTQLAGITGQQHLMLNYFDPKTYRAARVRLDAEIPVCSVSAESDWGDHHQCPKFSRESERGRCQRAGPEP